MQIETHYPYEKQSPPAPSREFVTSCFWSWSPSNDREESYFLAGGDTGLEWSLWVNPYCDVTDSNYWHRVADLRSDRSVSRKGAAVALLEAVWRVERNDYGFSDKGLTIEASGVLSVDEVSMIAQTTLGGGDRHRH